jgi:hypothetical protein
VSGCGRRFGSWNGAVADEFVGDVVEFPVAGVAGAPVGRVGKVVVVGDRPVEILGARFCVVSGKPLLGRDWLRLIVAVGLASGEFGGGPFGGGAGFGGMGVPGRSYFVGLGQLDGAVFKSVCESRGARTVPLVAAVVPIVERWAAGKKAGDWLFHAPEGGPLRETNWKRSVRWREAVAAIGRPQLRVHDLRHTAASVWLGSGADPKVVQRVLGHASAAMMMDLYGHLIGQNLWAAAARLGDTCGPARRWLRGWRR